SVRVVTVWARTWSRQSGLLGELCRPKQHRRGNRQADLFCGLEINDEVKLDWLFYRKIGRLGTFENFIDVGRCPPVHIWYVCAIRHKTPILWEKIPIINRRQPVLYGELCDLF